MGAVRRPQNVRVESWLLFGLSVLLGLRPICIKKLTFLGYVYPMIFLAGYVACSVHLSDYMASTYNRLEVYVVGTNLRRIQKTINMFFLPFMVITSLRSASKISRVYEAILSADECLHYLNVNFNHTHLKRVESIHVLAVMIAVIGFNLVDYYGFVNESTTYVLGLEWVINQLPEFINCFLLCAFFNLLTKIRHRFRKINEIIPEIAQGKYVNDVLKLRSTRQIHEHLHNAGILANEAYGIQLLVTFAVLFAQICLRFQVVAENKNVVDTIVEALWTCYFYGKFFYVVRICHDTSAEVEQTKALLHHYPGTPEARGMKDEMEDFSRQLASTKVQFTACHFFVIDYAVLLAVVTGMLAYIFMTAQLSSKS